MSKRASYVFLVVILFTCSAALLMLDLACTGPHVPGSMERAQVPSGSWVQDLVVGIFVVSIVAGTVMTIAVFATSFTLRKRRRKDDYERVPEPRRVSTKDLAMIAAALVAVLSLAAVLLVATSNLIATSITGASQISEAQNAKSDVHQAESSSLGQLPSTFARGLPRWRNWIVMLAGVTLLVASILVSTLQRARDSIPRHSRPEAPQVRDDRKTAVELIELSIRTIESEPDPRRAVIACYQQFEAILHQKGFPMPATYTPEEYLAGILRRFRVTPAPLWSLTLLFEKARFSNHDMTVGDKVAAIEALSRIKSGLTDPVCQEGVRNQVNGEVEPAGGRSVG